MADNRKEGVCDIDDQYNCGPKSILLKYYTLKSNPSETFFTSGHYSDVIMGAMASQISLQIIYSNVYAGADQRKIQSSVSLAFVRGIHRWPVNSLHKGPVTRKMFPFDDVIMLHAWIKSKWNIFHGWCGCVWTVLIDCGSGECRTYFSCGDIDPFIVAYVIGLLFVWYDQCSTYAGKKRKW